MLTQMRKSRNAKKTKSPMSKWLFLFAFLLVLLPLAYRTYMLRGFIAFSEDDIPDLNGKVAIVTGANTGLGFETARAFAEHGATVLLGCRDQSRCIDAANRINEKCTASGSGGSAIIPATLDLSSAASVEGFATSVKASYQKLDFLVNNAAVMAIPEAQNDVGIEMQFATNHIGHFLLTGHLLGLLGKAKGRVINHSSGASTSFAYKLFHAMEPSDSPVPSSGVNMSDLNWEHRSYDTYAAYSQTKRANLFFTHELNRRFNSVGITATSCEPGGSLTDLQRKATGMSEKAHAGLMGSTPFMSTAAHGAQPQIYATVRAKPNEFIGVLWGLMGPPVVLGDSLSHRMAFISVSYAAEEAKDLWETSEKLTGMTYSLASEAD